MNSVNSRQLKLEEVNQATPVEDQDTLTLSTGVVLSRSVVPKLFIIKLYEIYERDKPKIPMFFNKDKEREEENPGDPDYEKAVEQHDFSFTMMMTDLAIMRGTHPDHIPDSLEAITDEGWVEEQRFFGVEIPNSEKLRYLAWLTYVAVKTEKDTEQLTTFAMASMGVTEEAVNAEMQKFQGDEGRNADSNPET